MSKDEKKLTFLQKTGIARTVIRPEEESNIQLREDRIGRYFRKYLNRFVFVEFSDEFIAKSKAGDLLKGVPIPLRRKELKDFAGGDGVPMLVIAENMAWVMGCDPHFKYTQNYVDILLKLFNLKIAEGMLKEGRDEAERGELDNACIHFRACLCVRPDYLHGMYSYARACRALYENSNNEEYVGRFKAEALDWFELTTETHPRFAQAYYYLGYAYLNMGLYVKAQSVWTSFNRLSKNSKDRKEITKRLKQIQDPVNLELACNCISTGQIEKGIEVLEHYRKTQYGDWWPLYFYLGLGYMDRGDVSEAYDNFKKVLTINGSHIDTMKQLIEIYEAQGDTTNVKKYTEKIKLIEEAQAKEQAEHMKRIEKENKKLEEKEPRNLPGADEVNEPEEPVEETKGAPLVLDIDDVEEGKTFEDTEGEPAEKKSLVKRLGKKN